MKQGKLNRVGKKGLLVSTLLLLLIGGGAFRAIVGTRALPKTTDRIPMVLLGFQGEINPETMRKFAFQLGSIIYEGQDLEVPEGMDATFASREKVSFTLKGGSRLSIRSASIHGDRFELELELLEGRITARMDADDATLKIQTENVEYNLSGGTATILTSSSGDSFLVGTGKLTTSVSGREEQFGVGQSGAFGSFGESIPTGAAIDDFLALAQHGNSVGSADGAAPGELFLDLEKVKIQSLVEEGLVDLQMKKYSDLIRVLAPQLTVNGIPTTAEQFGQVVEQFAFDHTVLETLPTGEPLVQFQWLAPEPLPREPVPVVAPVPTTAAAPTEPVALTPAAEPTAEPQPIAGPPPPPSTAITTNLIATVIVTSSLRAEEQGPSGVTCGWSSNDVAYAFQLKYIDGAWKIVSLEVSTWK